MTRAEFCAFARAHDNFVILTHRRPDGDTIGSAGALCLGLRQLGKTAFVLTNEQFTPRFDPFLDGLVCEALPAGATVISADIASEGLLSFDAVRMGLTPVCAVDHHGSNSLACPKLVEADKAACGEIIHALLTELGVTVTKRIAECLYTAISTDTGCFKYSNTTSRTHIIAAKLMAYEFDVSGINYKLFDMKSKGRLELEQAITQGMEFFCDDRVAVVWLTTELMDRFNGRVDSEDFNGLASLPRQVEGVIIGATVKQKGPATFKISVRTAEPINAGSVCALFGGGGHARAAGCTIEGSIEFVKAKLLPVFEKALKANE